MAPEAEVAVAVRRITFSKPVTAAADVLGPGSAAHLLSFWPSIGKRATGRVLRALDKDLPPIQRLIWGSAARAEVQELGQFTSQFWRSATTAAGKKIDASPIPFLLESDAMEDLVPPLLWTNWATPLGVNPATEPSTLQRSLSKALRIAGLAFHKQAGLDAADVDTIAGIGKQLRPDMLGTPSQQLHVLRQLSELATYLRANPAPIHYSRRRHLAWWSLLPPDHWKLLAESAGESPGLEPKLLRARRYLFLRATGTGTRDLPRRWQIVPSTHDAADYTEFLTTMTSGLAHAMDQYLGEWLRIRGDTSHRRGLPPLHSSKPAPVVWNPPRWNDPEACLAPELRDIDLDTLHAYVRAGRYSISAMARVVDRTPRHVRWALSAFPVVASGEPQSIDWSTLIPPSDKFLGSNKTVLDLWAEDDDDLPLDLG